MDPMIMAIIATVLLFALIIIGMPIAISLLVAGVVGVAVLTAALSRGRKRR